MKLGCPCQQQYQLGQAPSAQAVPGGVYVAVFFVMGTIGLLWWAYGGAK